jgi:prophage regulatory protein
MNPPRLLRIKQVMERVAMGESTIHRRVALRTFPSPYDIGDDAGSAGSRWLESDINDWIASLPRRRDQARAA